MRDVNLLYTGWQIFVKAGMNVVPPVTAVGKSCPSPSFQNMKSYSAETACVRTISPNPDCHVLTGRTDLILALQCRLICSAGLRKTNTHNCLWLLVCQQKCYYKCDMLGLGCPAGWCPYLDALVSCKIWGLHGGDNEECHPLGCYAVWLL
jgi:hypothetical protein